MSFESDFDLFEALHSVKMIVCPVTINDQSIYRVFMTDEYDFAFEDDYSSKSTNLTRKALYAGVIAGNNLAYLDMNLGALNEYDVIIDFYVE